MNDRLCPDGGVKTRVLREFVAGLSAPEERKCDDPKRFPRLSIIMPSYNQGKFIERSILSVLNQNYPNLEFIVIDGGSKDGTVEIIRKFERYLSYWVSEPDSGQSDALNHGFSKATGDIVGWMNSDDLYLPQAFTRTVEAFREHPAAGIVFGDWWEIDNVDKVTSVHYSFDFNLMHFIYEGFHLNSQAMFWRREVHGRFGRLDVKLHRTMDYDLILRFGLVEGQRAFFRIPYPLACFRRHARQKTTGGNRVVHEEHRRIASKNNIAVKGTRLGKTYRLMYRFRRAYWYVKRGGLAYALARTVDIRARLKDSVSFRLKQ